MDGFCNFDTVIRLNWINIELELNNDTIVVFRAAYSWIRFIIDEFYIVIKLKWLELNKDTRAGLQQNLN